MIDLCAIRSLKQFLDEIEQHIRANASVALNEAYCLCAIEEGTTEPSQLARLIGLSPSRLSRILESLESKHLLRRNIADHDRRAIVVSLTDLGKETIQNIHNLNLPLTNEEETLLATLREKLL